jgi:hypothetical protein
MSLRSRFLGRGMTDMTTGYAVSLPVWGSVTHLKGSGFSFRIFRYWSRIWSLGNGGSWPMEVVRYEFITHSHVLKIYSGISSNERHFLSFSSIIMYGRMGR